MYKDIFESIRNEAEKRNLRERTIQLYCSDVLLHVLPGASHSLSQSG